jgi:hypothetical protein
MTLIQEVKTKSVYTIVERQQKSRWVRIGIGFVNRDGSINVRLDAVPVNGKLHLRDYKRREDAPAPDNGDPEARPTHLFNGGDENRIERADQAHHETPGHAPPY